MKKHFLVKLLLVIAFVLVLSISASAYKINYDNKASAETDASGTITLRDTKVNNLNTTKYTIKDANGNDVEITQQFLGWYTDDGRVFAPGETVTFTEDTRLYQASGATVYTYADLNTLLGKGWWFIKLGADITATSNISTCSGPSGTMSILDLNGHSINTSSSQAFGASRSGIMIVGNGTITHTGTGAFFNTSYHTYNPGNIRVYVGRNVTVNSGGILFTSNDVSGTSGIPKISVWGNVTASGICKLNKSTNAEINIYSGANVTITGATPINYTNLTGTNVYAKIRLEGNLTLTNPEAVLFTDFLTSGMVEYYTVTSGSYTLSSADAAELLPLLAETHMLKETANENGFSTYTVVLSDCVHNWVRNSEESVEALFGQNGLDVFYCTECERRKEVETVFSPATVEIKVTIKENGTDVDYVMPAGQIFNFEITKNGADVVCSITDVIYRKNDIVKLEIPYGVNLINITAMQSLKELTFMDNFTVDFKKNCVSNCPELETIILGSRQNAAVFAAGTNENTEAGFFANCPKLTTLDVSKTSATFNNYSFASNKTIKHLILGEGNSYNFGEYAFAHSQLTEVIIPDNTPTTYKKKSFAETETIEYIYVGANSIADKKLYDQSSLFGGNSKLSKVVLMDIEYIGQWVLSTKKPGNKYQPLSDVVVYTHSENLTWHAESFNDRSGNYVAYIYTLNTAVTAPSNCNYVIFKGIGHAYTEGVISESTCATHGKGGYVTDCPCNYEYRENSFTSISNKINDYKDKSFDAYGTESYDLPLKTEHTVSDVILAYDYKNGFMENGFIVYKCLYCDEPSYTEAEPSCDAIFTFVGYSTPQNGTLSLAISYVIDAQALEAYEELMGTLEYGVTACLTENLGGKAPLDVADAPVIKAELTGNTASFDFVIRGFNEDYYDLEITMCAYAYNGEKYVYLQKTQTDAPASVTINGILAAKA